jgi:GxxExxY protein
MNITYRELTESVLACAFDVHARLGPGLLESTYRSCLVHVLERAGHLVECEVPVAIAFDGVCIATAYRADVIIDRKVLLELKAVERVLSIHLAQLRTYLEHSRIPVGLLLNFNVKSLKDGIRRIELERSLSADNSIHSNLLPPTPPNSFFPS